MKLFPPEELTLNEKEKAVIDAVFISLIYAGAVLVTAFFIYGIIELVKWIL